MDQGKNLDLEIRDCLTRLDISAPAEWDVLAFVYQHQASLANADQIARLLGYPSTVVADALDHLEHLQLIGRSRASQGVRLYQFLPSEDSPYRKSFQQLITLANDPAGRSLLRKILRQPRLGQNLRKKRSK